MGLLERQVLGREADAPVDSVRATVCAVYWPGTGAGPAGPAGAGLARPCAHCTLRTGIGALLPLGPDA